MNLHHWPPLRPFSFVALLLATFVVLSVAANTQSQNLKAIYQINCGGPATGSYAQDAYFQGGQALTDTELVFHAGVPNSPPNSAYQTGRYGDFSYIFPNLKPGTAYKVRLHFAETLLARRDFGKRIFSVFINQKPVVEHFDVLKAAADKNVAVVKEFTLTTDAAGTITILFKSEVSEAMVNAIEIFAQQNASSGTTNVDGGQSNSPSSAVEENGRITRLSEIAFDLQDPKMNTASLITEAARLCGFAIWKENHTPIAAPTGPPLHLAVTDAEIERFSTMFRNGQSVALSDLINSVDYAYKSLGDGGSSREDVLAWLNTGDQSENASVRALTLFLKYRNDFKGNAKTASFKDTNVELDPIQALFILRVVTEDIAFPILHTARRAELTPAERPVSNFAIVPASFAVRDDCAEEGKDWAEDSYAGGITRLLEKVVGHMKGEEAGKTVGTANALISLVKFLSTYAWLKAEVRAESPPVIRTKSTQAPGDGPRTVIAKFSIDGKKVTDWLKANRCLLVATTLDFDLPETKPLSGIETSWRVDQSENPRQQIIWKATDTDSNGQRTAQQSLDRVPTDENGEAKVAWDGAPQPKKLPDKVIPYHRYVGISITPQAKNPQANQDFVDAMFGAMGIAGAKEGPLGVLTPIFEELYRLKWKGTAHYDLMVRDWRPEGPDEYSGGMKIFLTASGHDFRTNFAYKMSLDRTLEFIETKMGMISGDVPQVDASTLSQLPPVMRQAAEARLKGLAGATKNPVFYGFGPGVLRMTVNDNSFIRSTEDLCGDKSQSEKTSLIKGPKDGAPEEFSFGPLMPPGLTIYSVEIDLQKKIAIVKGDYALPVKDTAVTVADGKTTTTNKDTTRTIFQQLTLGPPFGPNGITVPIEVRSLDEEIAGTDATGISYSGKVTIPFTFGKYKGNAYLTFYIKKINKGL